jgi:hypothetical protein
MKRTYSSEEIDRELATITRATGAPEPEPIKTLPKREVGDEFVCVPGWFFWRKKPTTNTLMRKLMQG